MEYADYPDQDKKIQLHMDRVTLTKTSWTHKWRSECFEKEDKNIYIGEQTANNVLQFFPILCETIGIRMLWQRGIDGLDRFFLEFF